MARVHRAEMKRRSSHELSGLDTHMMEWRTRTPTLLRRSQMA